MKFPKLRLALLISLLIGVCSVGSLLKAVAKTETKTKVGKKEPAKAEAKGGVQKGAQGIEEVGEERPGITSEVSREVTSIISKKMLDLVEKVLGRSIRDALAQEHDINVAGLLETKVPGFPGLKALPEPIQKTLKKVIPSNLVITTPRVVWDDAGNLFISGSIVAAGKRTRARIRIMPKEDGGYGFAFFFNIVADFKFSDLVPKGVADKIIKKMEFLQVKEGSFFISTMQYDDPEVGTINKGFGLVGQLEYIGWAAVVNNMFAGIPQKLQARIKGTFVLPDLTGTNFEISIPLGITLLPDPFGALHLVTGKEIKDSHIAFGPFNFSVEVGDLMTVTQALKLKADGEVILQLIPSLIKANKKDILAVLKRAKKEGVNAVLNELKDKRLTEEINNQILALESIKERIRFQQERAICKPSIKPGDLKKIEEIKKKVAQDELADRIKQVEENKLGKGNLYRDFLFVPLTIGVSGVGSIDGLKITGEMKGTLRNAFGIQGLNYGDIKLGFNWDFALTATIGTALAVETAGLSYLLMAMPFGFTAGGKAEYGSTSVGFDFNIKVGKKIIDEFYLRVKGDIYLRDFVRFALLTSLDVMQLDDAKKKIDDFIKKAVLDVKMEDCDLIMSPFATEIGAKSVPASLKGKIGNFEVIPGIGGGGEIFLDKIGFKLELHTKDLYFPTKNKPFYSFTGVNKGEKPHFSVNIKLPFEFEAGIAGKINFNLPKPLNLTAKGDLFLSPLESHLKAESKVLGIGAKLDAVGKIKDPKSWILKAELDTKDLRKAMDKFSNLLFNASKEIEKAKEEVDKWMKQAKKDSDKAMDAAKKKAESAMTKEQKNLESQIKSIKNKISALEKKCR